jgi:ABC-type Na+ transport system ATPase subunit NatA
VRLSPFDNRVVDIKFFDSDGLDIDSATERKIEGVFFREDYRRVYLDEVGRIGDAENVEKIYTDAFLKALRPEALAGIARDFNLVIDYAYANVSSILPDILRRLEVDMVELNANLDDSRLFQSSEEFEEGMERLARITPVLDAHMGVRIDSGGEKLFLVDDAGRRLPGTQALAAKRITTYVPDFPNVYERLTGLEFLNFIGDVYAVPRGERIERIARWLEVFELEAALTSPIQSYSHGMKQKIVLTAALLPAPRVMVLDEPLVGLDPRAAHALKELMREHCNHGGTLFFSTHIMEVAEKLCDRVGIIHKGRLVACGTMEELRRAEPAGETLESIFLELTEGQA